jgi:hypothetical protein
MVFEVATVGPPDGPAGIDVQPCRKTSDKSAPDKALITVSLNFT